MSSSLIVENKGKTTEVQCKPTTTIGRDKNCDVVVVEAAVSRNHAMVRRLGNNDYYLIDEGSANGSFINGKRVSMPTQLKDNDLITIGPVKISFHQESEEESTTTSETDANTVLITQSIDVSQITILVADIRGFTSLSESLPIKTLTNIMNSWFHKASDCVQSERGMVDKFIGDCVYARWSSSKDSLQVLAHALRTACKLKDISEEINKKQPDLPRPIKIGVGINAGMAAVGVDRGSTAIGDAVNLAFRLEGSSKEIGKDIIIGRDAYGDLPADFWTGKQQTISIKGKAEPVEVVGLDFNEAQDWADRI